MVFRFSFPCSSVGMPTGSLQRHVFRNEWLETFFYRLTESISIQLNLLKLPRERLGRHYHAGAWEREKREKIIMVIKLILKIKVLTRKTIGNEKNEKMSDAVHGKMR